MNDHAPYDPIASVYDLHWGAGFSAVAKAAVSCHLPGRLPPGSAVLDLCCGTGLMLAHLQALGYRAYGVDESARMLEAASRNAPDAVLVHADMADFRFEGQFDAVLWFYNSLNHARSYPHLCTTLANVAAHLSPAAVLMFDYVLPEAFEKEWEWCESFQIRDRAWTLDYRFDRSTGHATCLVNQRDAIRQTAFTPQQITQAISAAGLHVLQELPMTGSEPSGLRNLVLAAKL